MGLTALVHVRGKFMSKIDYNVGNTTDRLPIGWSDSPEYEPRGCPRVQLSWYTYSPTRIRYPYVRGLC